MDNLKRQMSIRDGALLARIAINYIINLYGFCQLSDYAFFAMREFFLLPLFIKLLTTLMYV